MRSLIPILLALACPIGMCVIPMLLMRRRGAHQQEPSEAQRLHEENERLRAELQGTKEPSPN